MKQILIITLFSLSILSTQAQKNKRFERIKTLKIAHITQALNLSSPEAEKFWPVYNRYEKELFNQKNLRSKTFQKELKAKGGIDKLSEKEADELVSKFQNIEKTTQRIEQEKFESLRKVLSAKQILKLYRAERSFNKRLLERLNKPKGRK